MRDIVKKIIACPKCKGNFIEADNHLKCKKCKLKFEIKENIPVLEYLPSEDI